MKLQQLQDASNYRSAETDMLRAKLRQQQEMDDLLKARFSPTPAGTMTPADMDASQTALQQGAGVGDVGPTATNAARMNAIRPQALQGANSAFPFSLNDIALLKTRGVDLTDVYKLATDPVKMEGGSVYKDRSTGTERYIPKLDNGLTIGPNGVVSVLPGYARGNADIKGAETLATEGAKASLDPFYAVGPGGAKYLYGSRATAMGFRPGPPDQGGPGQIGDPGGFGGPLKVEQSPSDVTYGNDVAKEQAARFAEMGKSALNAQANITRYQRMNQLLGDFEGGKLAGAGLSLAKAANSLGLKLDPKLGDKEAAAALSNELALSLRNPAGGAGMPGSMSDSDRAFLQQMSPSLAQSAAGRKQIIDTNTRLGQRAQQVYRMAAAYQKKYGRVTDDFYTQLQDWANRNPVFGGQ
jgi:hypothetical protein